MNSEIKELYEVACQYLTDSFTNPDDFSDEYSQKLLNNAFKVIELVEGGDYEEALKVGLIY